MFVWLCGKKQPGSATMRIIHTLKRAKRLLAYSWGVLFISVLYTPRLGNFVVLVLFGVCKTSGKLCRPSVILLIFTDFDVTWQPRIVSLYADKTARVFLFFFLSLCPRDWVINLFENCVEFTLDLHASHDKCNPSVVRTSVWFFSFFWFCFGNLLLRN